MAIVFDFLYWMSLYFCAFVCLNWFLCYLYANACICVFSLIVFDKWKLKLAEPVVPWSNLKFQGLVKLADFGVATKLTEADVNTHSVVGTPYWMAPEVYCSLSWHWDRGFLFLSFFYEIEISYFCKSSLGITWLLSF